MTVNGSLFYLCHLRHLSRVLWLAIEPSEASVQDYLSDLWEMMLCTISLTLL